jgi:hypothetical protein
MLIRAWKEQGENRINNFRWCDVKYDIPVRTIVVYIESDLQDDHRAGKVILVEGEGADTLVTIQLRRFTDSMFFFTGATMKCSLAFLKPIEAYDLHIARRFSYYGPPPRTVRYHNQIVATRLVDAGSKHFAPEVPGFCTGYLFQVQASPTERMQINAMFLGAICSYHNDNSEWKALCVVMPDNEDLEEFALDTQGLLPRLSATMVSDFCKLFSPNADFAVEPFAEDSDPGIVEVFQNCFAIIDAKLMQEPSWRPPTLSKVWKDVTRPGNKTQKQKSAKGVQSSSTTKGAAKKPVAIRLSSDSEDSDDSKESTIPTPKPQAKTNPKKTKQASPPSSKHPNKKTQPPPKPATATQRLEVS